MSTATILYATDEDIALRASSDFTLLCPRDQKVAVGTDGVFLPSDPWTLASVMVDFQARGVSPGQVALIERPATCALPAKDGFVVVATAPGTMTLRRKGQAAGSGEPPGPASGLIGVGFSVLTFGPQIALATSDINRRFGISTGLTGGRCVGELADPGELCDVAVLTVLYRQYLDMSRELGEAKDTFAAKAQLVKGELDERLDRLAIHWAGSIAEADLAPPSTRFSTRMSR